MKGPQPSQIFPDGAPLPRRTELESLETELAGIAARLADADSQNGDRLAAVSQAHRLHAAALQADEPLSRPSPVSTSPQPSSKKNKDSSKERKALSRQRAEQLKTVRKYAGAGAESENGLRSLLLGSLAAFAAAAPTLAGSGTVALTTPSPQVLATSEGVAASDLLRQLYAIVYGYQAAAAPLSPGSKAREECMDRLAAHERLRDTLVDALSASKTEVPVADAVYALPYQVSDAKNSAKLRAEMESALLPYLGGWLAVAGDSRVSRLSMAGLAAGATTAAKLGGKVPAWPGFND